MSVDVDELITRVRRVSSFDVATASESDLDGIAPAVSMLIGWISTFRAACAGRRDDLARAGAGADTSRADPKESDSRANRQRPRTSAREIERHQTLARLPALRGALQRGAISVDHIDAVTAALRDLTEEQRSTVAEHGEELAVFAQAQTPGQFDVTLRRIVHKVTADTGLRRLQRQRADTSLRGWLDHATGMIKIFGQFDPERGAIVLNQLQARLDLMHAQPVPADCPDDPAAKNDHLRALALLQLLQQRVGAGGVGAPAGGGPEDATLDMVVVVDLDTLVSGLHDDSIIDAGHGIDLPVDTLRRMACCANIVPAVLDTNGVTVDLGRRTRLANRAQRRALRAMYATCAIDGCTVGFDHCKVHHIEYWTSHRGRTDLINLLPLCQRHHHAAHEGGWTLSLHPTTRDLTIRRPDGSVTSSPAPRAHRRSGAGVGVLVGAVPGALPGALPGADATRRGGLNRANPPPEARAS